MTQFFQSIKGFNFCASKTVNTLLRVTNYKILKSYDSLKSMDQLDLYVIRILKLVNEKILDADLPDQTFAELLPTV